MRARDRGSVLLLMPAAVLIVVILGSIAVDFSVAYLGRRELLSAAAAAANDAATHGVDEDAYHNGEGYRLDPARVDAAVAASITGHDLDVDNVLVVVAITDLTVTVTIEGDVPYIFARAIPAAPDHAHVVARASATAEPPEP
jgi:hypothetical protein